MRHVVSALFALLLVLVAQTGPVCAQPGIGIGFRNELKAPVIVQGYSIVAGVPRKGPPIVLAPGRVGLDNLIPPGPRFYNVYDANQPARVFLRDFPVSVTGQDLFFAIRPSPVNPQGAILVLDPRP